MLPHSTNSLAHLFLLVTSSIAAQLPPYDGVYGVGTVTIEVPVAQPRNISNETITASGQPAFQLETILFSIYYPADKTNQSSKPSPPWLPEPIDLIVQGIADGTNGSVSADLVKVGLQGLAGDAVIPAFVDVPIANETKFPLMVFSHGDTSLPQWYSRYLGSIAANGNVVVAITHRDGSNAGSVVMLKGGTSRNVTYILPTQLSPSVNATGLAMIERTFRQAEVNETILVLKSITNGHGDAIFQNSSRGEGQTLSGWKGLLDFDNLVISGHSFGATSALDTLQAPNTTDYSIRAGLTLDPGKESGPLSTNITVPILIADSEAWSSQPTEFYGKQHFNVVKGIAETSMKKTNAGWFMTLLGSSHSSITDAGLIAGSTLLSFFDSGSANTTIDSGTAITQYVRVSNEFLSFLKNGTRLDVLASNATDATFVAKPNSTNPNNELSYWEIHIAPAANATATSSAPGASGTKKSAANMVSLSAGLYLLSAIMSVAFIS